VTRKRRKNQNKASTNAKRLTKRNQRESWNSRKQLQLEVQCEEIKKGQHNKVILMGMGMQINNSSCRSSTK
jgi:hypothetical protein